VWPEKLTRRWKVEVGEGYATPIVIGRRVYAFTRRDSKEALLALDAATGKFVWQTSYAAPPLSPGSVAAKHGDGPKATPLFHNGKLYTLGLGGALSAFDAATGKLLWQKPAPPEPPYYGMAVSPLGDKDLVIVHPGSHGSLTAFDANTGNVKWAATGDSAWASPIILSEKSSGQFFALDAKTGQTLWLGAPREASNTAVVKAGKLLFLLNDNAELIVARSSRTGFEPLKRYTVADSATWAQPAISGKRVFVKDVTSLALWIFD